MRTVCHYTDSTGFGGAEQAMLALIAGLDRDRWRPVLVHGHGDSGPLVAAARRLGIDEHPVAVPAEGVSGLARVPSLARRLRTIAPDVFHAHLTWSVACRSALAAAQVARVPAVVATHHLFIDVPLTAARRVQQRLVGVGVAHVAVSEYVRRRLEATFPWMVGRVRVIPNCVDAPAFEVTADPDLRARLAGNASAVALVPARLEPQKGHANLLTAAARLPGFRFVLAGDGSLRASLEAHARAAGLGERVIFLGHREDMPQLMACSDLIVLPSLEEGLPLVVLEAMAAGRPVVATRAGGTGEVITDGLTGVLVPPGDSEALRAAVAGMAADPQRAARLAAAGRELVNRDHRPEALVDATCSLYDELLGVGNG